MNILRSCFSKPLWNLKVELKSLKLRTPTNSLLMHKCLAEAQQGQLSQAQIIDYELIRRLQSLRWKRAMILPSIWQRRKAKLSKRLTRTTWQSWRIPITWTSYRVSIILKGFQISMPQFFARVSEGKSKSFLTIKKRFLPISPLDQTFAGKQSLELKGREHKFKRV